MGALFAGVERRINAAVLVVGDGGLVSHFTGPEELHRAASVPKTILWYDAGHGLNQQAVFDRLDWLHGQIGLDARN